MIIVQTAHYMIKTQYYKNNNGTHCFQRRVPADVRLRLGKSIITIKLTGKETAMVAELTRHKRETDRLFNDIRAGLLDTTELDATRILESYGLFAGAGLVRMYDNDGINDQPHLDEFMSDLEQQRAPLTEAQKLAKHLLTKPAPVTLAKALQIYFEHHVKGENIKFQKEFKQHTVALFAEIGSYNVESITRAMVRDFINKRLTEVKTLTVKRELSVIRAAMKVVIREKGLKIDNVFEQQTIPNLGRDKKIRLSFTHDELMLFFRSCLSNPNTIKILWLLGILTGARLSEIAGLRRRDVHLEDDVPFLEFVEFDDRTLKTEYSARLVPILPVVIPALREHLASHTSEYVFPQYMSADGRVLGDNASANAKNFAKRIGINKTFHHTRHTMRDLLRHADVPDIFAKGVQGWANGSVSEGYGQGYLLRQKLKALESALAPVLLALHLK